jgi:hypothetical protein
MIRTGNLVLEEEVEESSEIHSRFKFKVQKKDISASQGTLG